MPQSSVVPAPAPPPGRMNLSAIPSPGAPGRRRGARPITKANLSTEANVGTKTGWNWVRADWLPMGYIEAVWSNDRRQGYVRMCASTTVLVNEEVYVRIFDILLERQGHNEETGTWRIEGERIIPADPISSVDTITLHDLRIQVSRLGGILAEGAQVLKTENQAGYMKQKAALQAYFRMATKLRAAEAMLAEIRERFGACQEMVEVLFHGDDE